MILILSESNSISVAKVMAYLPSKLILRYNDKLPVKEIEVGGKDILESDINFKSFKSVWYYRSYLEIAKVKLLDEISLTENKLFLEYLLYKNKETFIGSFNTFFFQNTLIQLEEAINVGLDIPKTFISQSLPEFGNSKIVNKIVGNAKSFSSEDCVYYSSGTQFVNKQSYYNNGHLNFLQEYIEKEFEIRIFYFLGKFFTMAIFSQKDEKTQVDYRNYNKDKPNRNIPFSLPLDIQSKLKKLMNKLDLNTGSIDMIYTKSGKFVFLEINSCGIFDWLSTNCNYYIEKHIAKTLEYGKNE